MNRCEQIREYLATQDGPRKASQITIATGLTPKHVAGALGCMLRSKLVQKDGRQYGARYSVVRAVVTVAERNRAMAMRRLGRTAAEIEQQQEAVAARNKRRSEVRSASQTARRVAARVAAGKPPHRVPKAPSAAMLREGATAAVRDVSADIAAFLAKGGKIQTLAPCTWSTALRSSLRVQL